MESRIILTNGISVISHDKVKFYITLEEISHKTLLGLSTLKSRIYRNKSIKRHLIYVTKDGKRRKCLCLDLLEGLNYIVDNISCPGSTLKQVVELRKSINKVKKSKHFKNYKKG